jgi:hypothetical protein
LWTQLYFQSCIILFLALSLFYTLMSNSGIPVKLIDRLKAKNNVNIS